NGRRHARTTASPGTRGSYPPHSPGTLDLDPERCDAREFEHPRDVRLRSMEDHGRVLIAGALHVDEQTDTAAVDERDVGHVALEVARQAHQGRDGGNEFLVGRQVDLTRERG